MVRDEGYLHRILVTFATKSPLILRDLNLLSRMAEDTCCTVGVIITTMKRELANFLEPNAPDPAVRLDIVREIKRKTPQIQAGVHLISIVPFLGGDLQNLESIVDIAARGELQKIRNVTPALESRIRDWLETIS